MSLRVIGGEYGGRVLKSVRGFGTRPLLGQVREALFNILADRVGGGEVWDLFAGTGANGIEALSRGADRVWFLEKANPAIAVLRENLELLGEDAEDRSEILKVDAWDPPPMSFDDGDQEIAPAVIFYDPPYKAVTEDPVRAAFRAMRLADRLAADGVLCFHFQEGRLDRDDFDAELDVDLRTWGSTAIALIEAPVGAPKQPTNGALT